ncbi:hypothetical protein PM082_020001 [Marasmius tenuissimus]|nr:hypothetical protein PM082_020001 [Marasmius tenuissimus]
MTVSHSAPSTPSRNRVRAVNPGSPQAPSRIVLLDEFCQQEREISAMNDLLIQAQSALEEAERRRVEAQRSVDYTLESLSRQMREINLTYNALTESFTGSPALSQPVAGLHPATPPASPSAARGSHSTVPPGSPSPAPTAALPPNLTIVGSTQPSAMPGRSNFSAYIVYSRENGGHGRFDTWEEVEAFCTSSSNVLKGFMDPRLADELYDEFCHSEIGELFRLPPSTGELFIVLSGLKPGVYKNRALAIFYGTQYGGGSARRLLCGLPEAWATFREWKKQGLVTATTARNPGLFE